ncbi:Uncharacterised protein [Leclercia adecarboxylata]|uniref:Uncharacterized protein n=1 Tax=Leclercia adecarboxylata TaxID=83655 RepID=A0A4U9IV89_9ENTR|nr:Uncharacterised protein [Leclercia adecarboxylata]
MRIPLLSGLMVRSNCSEAMAGRAGNVDNGIFSIKGKDPRTGDAIYQLDIGRRTVDPHLIVTKNLPNQEVARR